MAHTPTTDEQVFYECAFCGHYTEPREDEETKLTLSRHRAGHAAYAHNALRMARDRNADLLAALEAFMDFAPAMIEGKRVQDDFSYLNAHAYATKLAHQAIAAAKGEAQ